MEPFFENDYWYNSWLAADIMDMNHRYFMRNDKFSMSQSMEGRFPLATKMFMQYCLSMHTDLKLGPSKNDTKIFIKKAYAGKLPTAIINKLKTGWTVPVGHWLTTSTSTKLTKFYKDRTGEQSKLDITKASQKAGKALIPAWMVSDWIKKYSMNR